DSPRHGYELIRLLEDQFLGRYAPSAGTIYPRLARLEAEGLVTHSQQGGRKVYAITPAGRDELARRSGEQAGPEAAVRRPVRGMAAEIRAEVRDMAGDLKGELRRAAREMRRQQHPGWSGPPHRGEPGRPGAGHAVSGRTEVDRTEVEQAEVDRTGAAAGSPDGRPGPGYPEPGPLTDRLVPRVQELVAQVTAT